jgi:hypothetical protein
MSGTLHTPHHYTTLQLLTYTFYTLTYVYPVSIIMSAVTSSFLSHVANLDPVLRLLRYAYYRLRLSVRAPTPILHPEANELVK